MSQFVTLPPNASGYRKFDKLEIVFFNAGGFDICAFFLRVCYEPISSASASEPPSNTPSSGKIITAFHIFIHDKQVD